MPIAVLSILELGLRLVGFGGYPPMLQKVGPVAGGNLVIADQAGASSWFFASPRLAGRNEQSAFLDPKPTNTVRVFCLGESAMQGYPQPRQLASSAFLERMLADAWPTRNVEVINLGTTAIASYPVLGILTEALPYEPDLVIIYTGNNEFFGTYGVASTGRAGSQPWMLPVYRYLHSLALVQGLRHLFAANEENPDRTLMETMMAQNYIGPEDWRRPAAEANLRHNLSEMIRRCRVRGVPVLVCTLPANECDLAPIGNDRLAKLPVANRAEVESLLATAESPLSANLPAAVRSALERVLQMCPTHARAHFLLGKHLAQSGQPHEALEQFVAARDLDTMPWRPPSAIENSVQRAARDAGAPVCDLLAAFRAASPGGAIGWELMDDHVHPSLRGQALVAECIVNALTNFDGELKVTPATRNRMAPWTEYARQLGDNEYDRFGVAHNMRTLFNAPFMRAHNPQAFAKANALATSIESQMPPDVRKVLHEWQATRPFAGARCPVTAAVAQLLLKQDDYQAARRLYTIAQRAVPQYTSWYLEYTYYALFCHQRLNRTLGPTELAQARAAIRQGQFLSRHPAAENGFESRYTGLLQILCGEFSEAIPNLLASREKQTGFDRLVVDQTLMVCYLQTRQFDEARKVLTAGLSGAGKYAEQYQSLLSQLPALESALTVQTKTNLMNQPGN